MKSLNEVIRANECCDHGELDSRCEDCPYNGIGACCAERESDALHYLEKYRDNYEARNDQVKRYQKAAQQCEEVLKDYIALKQIALRQYCASAQDNPPLTWNELKQMEGKPVWIEERSCRLWIIARNFQRVQYENIDTEWLRTDIREIYYDKADIGKTWQAYRKERTN